MSLECLAILGVKNEPLYTKTPSGNRPDRSDESNDDDHDHNNNDVFGFLEAQSSGLTIRQEVRECICDMSEKPAPEN